MANALTQQKTNSLEHKIKRTMEANTVLERKVRNMMNRFASSSDRIGKLRSIMRVRAQASGVPLSIKLFSIGTWQR